MNDTSVIDKPIPERLAVLEYRASEMDSHLSAIEIRFEKSLEGVKREIMTRFDALDKKDGKILERLVAFGTLLVALGTLFELISHHI